jgi:hypothetical protein
VVAAANYAFERTVMRFLWRSLDASKDVALASASKPLRAAAQLRR